MSFEVFVLLIALALAFDFMNGFHDAANSIATVVSTGVLKPHHAVAFASFFNFVALPITFGIGVDYGVNMFQRYKLEGGGSILKVIRNTGGPVGLCSFTTAVGYGSLLLAGNQGFVSFGTLAVAGEVTCVIAAVVSLPAFLYWQYKRGLQK